jgi:hypothetical protein
MATSGEVVFELTRNQVIKAALRKIGAIAKGQEPDTEDYDNAQQALNSLVAEYQTYGMPSWKRAQLNLIVTPGLNSYIFGALSVTSGGVYWDGGVTWDGGVLFDGAAVTSGIDVVPLKIHNIILRQTGGSAQEVFDMARKEFNLLNTTSTGKPVQYTYQPFINSGELRIWPIPDNTYTLEITYQEQHQGFTAGTDTPDFTQEWQNALVFGLASLLAPEYGVPIQDRQYLDKRAEQHLDIAKNFDFENTSMFFQVDRRE